MLLSIGMLQACEHAVISTSDGWCHVARWMQPWYLDHSTNMQSRDGCTADIVSPVVPDVCVKSLIRLSNSAVLRCKM